MTYEYESCVDASRVFAGSRERNGVSMQGKMVQLVQKMLQLMRKMLQLVRSKSDPEPRYVAVCCCTHVPCCVLLHTCTLLCVVALQDTARHSKTQQDTARHSQTQHDTKRHAARYIGSVAVSVSVVQCFVERRAVSCGAPTRLASLGAIRMSHSYEPHGLPNEPYNESKEPYYESKKPHKESK